jgi:hypothetical protein
MQLISRVVIDSTRQSVLFTAVQHEQVTATFTTQDPPEVPEQRQPHQLLVQQELALKCIQREELCWSSICEVCSDTCRTYSEVPWLLAGLRMAAGLQVKRIQRHLIRPCILQIHKLIGIWIAVHACQQLRPC